MNVYKLFSFNRLAALAAGSTIALAMIAGPAHAEDNQNSSRSNNAGALYLALSEDTGDLGGTVDALSGKLGALDGLVGQFRSSLEEAKRISAEVAALNAKLEADLASRASAAGVDYEKLLEDAAAEFEARIATESGGEMTADLALELEALLAGRKQTINMDDFLAVSQSIAEVDATLAKIDQTVAELEAQFATTLDTAVKAGYDLAQAKKV